MLEYFDALVDGFSFGCLVLFLVDPDDDVVVRLRVDHRGLLLWKLLKIDSPEGNYSVSLILFFLFNFLDPKLSVWFKQELFFSNESREFSDLFPSRDFHDEQGMVR